MLNYTGTGRVDYEEALRAIGRFIDESNMKEICIVELKEGMLVRGLSYSAERSGFQTISESFLFTNEDIEQAIEEGYKRRQEGRNTQPNMTPQSGGLTK